MLCKGNIFSFVDNTLELLVDSLYTIITRECFNNKRFILIDFIAEGGLVSFCIELDLDSNFELGHLSACPDEFRGSIFFRLGMFPL